MKEILNTYSLNRELIFKYLWVNKLNKKQFCEKCDISYKTFNKIVNNEKNIRLATIFKIAKCMNAKIHDLIK